MLVHGGGRHASGRHAATLLLARAASPEQEAFIGNQPGGRVFLFLKTDDFDRDYEAYRARGVRFVRPPAEHPYGKAAVFEDLYGNLWDLIQFAGGRRPGLNNETGTAPLPAPALHPYR